MRAASRLGRTRKIFVASVKQAAALRRISTLVMLAGSKILMLLSFAARIAKFQRVNFKSIGVFTPLFVTKRGIKFYALILLRKIYRMKFHCAKPFAPALCGS